MFVNVILPLPLDGTFTYHVPSEKEPLLNIGSRVIVPFGKTKFYTGIVVNTSTSQPEEKIVIKDILEVLDKKPSVLPLQIKLWQWMSQYYMCSIGDVFKAALPSGMKLESEMQLTYNADFDSSLSLTKREAEIIANLQGETSLSVGQLQKRVQGGNILPQLHALMRKGAIELREEIKNTYRPKQEIRVRLPKKYLTKNAVNECLQMLQRTPKRLNLFQKYLELSGLYSALNLDNLALIQEVSRTALLTASGESAAVLQGLREKGVLETYACEVERLLLSPKNSTTKINRKSIGEILPLSPAQETAYQDILRSFQQKNICLLHGVTSSGKTEIYIRLIRKIIEEGGQVLYLLPEIALTTQITTRLQRVFDSQMVVYHSKFPSAERVEIWNHQLSDHPFSLVLGARSALFLPYQNLKLVIVDEEHETSYKQQEPAPRYNARDTALILASHFRANTLLGTATPSLEVYHKAQQGKYAYVSLTTRFGDIKLPQIEIADVQDLMHRKMMNPPFSPRLEEEIQQALDNHEQVILFQNRRGHSPLIECPQCGWIPSCQKCDVHLTYHKETNRLVCHYCGQVYALPTVCPACHNKHLKSFGFGTEKIEEEVHKRFPQARTARLDLDTTRSRTAYENILQSFAEKRTDILIGTQMVSKGLDFDNVRVVGIMDADQLLSQPDFRAFERSFQMMAQVAGRAGRRNRRGLVILQTKHADYPIVQQVVNNDYLQMYQNQLEERQDFVYPPFCRMIVIYLRHREDRIVSDAAQYLGTLLQPYWGENCMGPDKPVISRIQLLYIRRFFIKVQASDGSFLAVRQRLWAAIQQLKQQPAYHTVGVYFDVDPL